MPHQSTTPSTAGFNGCSVPIAIAPIKRELCELQHKVDATTNESLESTRRMRALIEGSKEYGIRTLVELDDQGEKLDNAEKGMTQIHDDMKQAKEQLNGMGILAGLLPAWKKVRRGSKEDSTAWKGSEDGKVTTANNQTRRVTCPNIHVPGGYIERITNDSREDEMDANLSEISSILGNLKNMALDIDAEINTQNGQVDRIKGMSETNQESVKGAVEKTKKLLTAK